MHKSFVPLFVLALIGVIGGTIVTADKWRYMPIIIGILPLLIYHGILIRSKKLSPNEVDSIYYFGFLITVITLVATAISLGAQNVGKLDHKTILLQFGLGLIATGYALFARLHLLTKLNSFSEFDFLASSQNLSDRVDGIATELTRAHHQISAFIDLSKQTFNEAKERFDRDVSEREKRLFSALDESVTTIMNGMSATINGATKQFSEAISCVMEEIGRIQMEAEAISFTQASVKIGLFTDALNVSMKNITDTAVQAGQETNVAISELTKAARKMQKFATQITESAMSLESLQNLVDVVGNLAKALDGMSYSASASGGALSALEIKIRQADSDIQEKIINPVNSSSVHEVLGEIAVSFSSASTPLINQINTLNEQMKILSGTVSAMGGAFKSNDIDTGLKSVIDQIKKFDIQASQISYILESHRNNLDKALRSVIAEFGNVSALTKNRVIEQAIFKASTPDR